MNDRDLQKASNIKEFGNYGLSHSFIQERKKKKKMVVLKSETKKWEDLVNWL